MKISRIWITALTFLFLANGARADKLKVVTTTSDLADIATRIAGDKADVRYICKGTEDPHFLNARPSYIMMARNADLWIRVGMDLEIGWEPPVLEGSRNRRIPPGQPGHLDASAKVIKLDIPEGPISRAMGDVHPSGNPHYWLDPYNMRQVAGTIAGRLVELRPGSKDVFLDNLERFEQELDERMFGKELVKVVGGDALWAASLDGSFDEMLKEKGVAGKLGGWAAAMKPLRGKGVVTFHKSWIYFLERFGLHVPIELEPKAGIPPTAAHLASVTELMQNQNVSIILQEPFYSRKAADRVAKQTGARVIVAASSVGGTPEASDVLSVVDLVVEAMKGK